MSQVSKRILDEDISQKINENLWEVLSNLKDKEETQRFLYDFLTPTEQIMLAKRLAIALMLHRGYSHRDISGVLKVSTSTVINIVFWMKYEGKGYRRVLDKLLQKEAIKAIWYKIDDWLQNPLAPGLRGKDELREFYKKKYRDQPIRTPVGFVKRK